ncbi:MAG TPA: iron-containing alcohol dehydrogenase [Ramlibacter sp.]|nr:iron-containing alcohol dehydrogenase [Ramlibacter sp.]
MTAFSFETTPRIVCARGAAARLAEYVKGLGQRVLIVTDAALVKAGLVEPATRSLEAAGLRAFVFADVLPDPPEQRVLEAVAFARSHAVDVVVGLGGGSSMDTAKLVALLANSTQHLQDIYGVGLATGRRLPLLQMPTTAGTGSEVTPISIVTTPDHEKKGVVSPLLYPDAAILDAELTMALPPAVTAMTGVDAMVHAIEAYTSRIRKNPLSDTFAVQALRLLYANIEQAVTGGKDVEVRERMLLGSLMAGMAFANAPVAAVHALAYPLGGHYGLPHGLTNALMLVPTLRFNLPQASIAYAELGRSILPDAAQAPDAVVAERFISALAELLARMPHARSLRDAKVPRADLPMLARDAMNVQRLLVNNPREVTYEDALALYEQAW